MSANAKLFIFVAVALIASYCPKMHALESLSSNQNAVLQELGSIAIPTPEEAAIFAQLILLDPIELKHALDRITGEQYTNLGLANEISNRKFIRRLFEPIRNFLTTRPCPANCICVDGVERPLIDVWFEGSGGRSFFCGNHNARGFRLSDYELTLGAQTTVFDKLLIGTAASYEVDHISYRLGGTNRSHFGMGAIYAAFRACDYYLFADFVGGYRREILKRPIRIGSIRLGASSNPKVWQGTLYVETGLDYTFNAMLIQPFLGFEAGYYRFKTITESGGGPLGLVIKSRSQTLAYSRLGIHFTTKALPSRLSMGLDLAWQYRLNSQDNHVREYFNDFGSTFAIKGLRLQRNSIDVAVRIIQGLCQGWELFAEANGQSWQNAFSYSFIGGIVTSW